MRLLSIFFWVVFAQSMQAQFAVHGNVRTADGQPLEGAQLALNTQSTSADVNGRFSFTALAKGNYHLHVVYVGYREIDTLFNLQSNLHLQLVMQPEVTTLDEVQLAQSRINTALQKKSALTTEVVTPAELRKFRQGSLSQSLERIAGVTSMNIGASQSKPVIRGLGFNRVVVTENGIKHEGQQWGADHGLEMDQFATGSVKIIKGPASLQYGSEAIGGIIQIEKPEPPKAHTTGGNVELTGKSNNESIGGSVNLYTRTHSWFAQARVTASDYADYQVPVDRIHIYSSPAPLHQNRMRNTAGNELNFHLNTGYLGTNWETVFYASHLQSQSGLFANAHGLEPRNVDNSLHDSSRRDLQNPRQQVAHSKIQNRTRIKSGQHQWEIEAAFQRNYREEFSDYIPHGFMPSTYPTALGIAENLEREFDKSVYTVVVHDQLDWRNHRLRWGVNGEYQNNAIGGWSFIIPAFKQRTAGVFAYDHWEVTDLWSVHAGVRFDYGRIETERYRDWFTSIVNDLPLYVQRSQPLAKTFYSPSWALGVNYNPGEWAFRANIGQSYRMPQAKELAANGVNYHQFSYELGNPNLAAEKAYQLDLGVSYENADWAVEATPYLNYFPNYIYLNPTPQYDYQYGAGNQIYQYTQNEVWRSGFELRTDYRLNTQWRIEAVGEYVYARQTSGPKRHFSLPFTPPASALFSLHYTRDFNRIKKVYATLDYKLVAEQNRIAPPEQTTAGYQLVNLACGGMINWNQQPIEVQVQIQNLFNTTYYNHASFYRLIGVPEPGRNLVISLQIPFLI